MADVNDRMLLVTDTAACASPPVSATRARNFRLGRGGLANGGRATQNRALFSRRSRHSFLTRSIHELSPLAYDAYQRQPDRGNGGICPGTARQAVPLRDFFKNPEQGYFRLSPDGKMLGFMQPYESRMNIFVQPIDKAGSKEGVKRITAETARDISNYFFKGRSTSSTPRISVATRTSMW